MPAMSSGESADGRYHSAGEATRPVAMDIRTAAARSRSIGIGHPAVQHAPEWRQRYPMCVLSQNVVKGASGPSTPASAS
jgi:hypothetical protein